MAMLPESGYVFDTVHAVDPTCAQTDARLLPRAARSSSDGIAFSFVVQSLAMTTADKIDIQGRIIARLRERGPATVATLALELSASQFDVQSALSTLRDEELVRLLFGGLWDAHWTTPQE